LENTEEKKLKKIVINYKKPNKGHYTPGIISNGILYISGQLSRDPDTQEIPEGGIENHMRVALNNMDRVLKAANVERSQVIKCTIHVADIDNWDAINSEYADFFGEHKPARIVCQTEKLHFGCLVEIEGIAEVEEK